LAYFAFWLALEPIHDGDPASIRVTGVHTDDNYGYGFREGFAAALQVLSFSGAADVDVQFHAVPHPSKGEADDWDAEVKDVIDALKEEEPHIVLFVGYEDTADILSQMKVEPTLNTLPVLLTDGVSSKALATTYQPEDVKPEHIFGVQPGFRTGAAYEHFKALYATTSVGETVPPAWTEYTYDGVYLLAYAAAGIEPEAISGAAFAEAFKRFDEPDGRIVNVGPDHLLVACQDMGTGLGIDVRGASGPLDFDLETGEPMSVGILRWTVDFPNPEEPGQLADCGLAMVHDANASGPQTYWCGARCLAPPSDNAPCEAGYCSEEGAACANDVCTGGDDCKPEHAP
jgi:branched-chain amino acid transport system substrate-binding protein